MKIDDKKWSFICSTLDNLEIHLSKLDNISETLGLEVEGTLLNEHRGT